MRSLAAVSLLLIVALSAQDPACREFIEVCVPHDDGERPFRFHGTGLHVTGPRRVGEFCDGVYTCWDREERKVVEVAFDRGVKFTTFPPTARCCSHCAARASPSSGMRTGASRSSPTVGACSSELRTARCSAMRGCARRSGARGAPTSRSRRGRVARTARGAGDAGVAAGAHGRAPPRGWLGAGRGVSGAVRLRSCCCSCVAGAAPRARRRCVPVGAQARGGSVVQDRARGRGRRARTGGGIARSRGAGRHPVQCRLRARSQRVTSSHASVRLPCRLSSKCWCSRSLGCAPMPQRRSGAGGEGGLARVAAGVGAGRGGRGRRRRRGDRAGRRREQDAAAVNA
jgi:hypothetical protein